MRRAEVRETSGLWYEGMVAAEEEINVVDLSHGPGYMNPAEVNLRIIVTISGMHASSHLGASCYLEGRSVCWC